MKLNKQLSFVTNDNVYLNSDYGRSNDGGIIINDSAFTTRDKGLYMQQHGGDDDKGECDEEVLEGKETGESLLYNAGQFIMTMPNAIEQEENRKCLNDFFALAKVLHSERVAAYRQAKESRTSNTSLRTQVNDKLQNTRCRICNEPYSEHNYPYTSSTIILDGNEYRRLSFGVDGCVQCDVPMYTTLPTQIEELQQNVSTLKERVIRCKLDHVFGYKSDRDICKLLDDTEDVIESNAIQLTAAKEAYKEIVGSSGDIPIPRMIREIINAREKEIVEKRKNENRNGGENIITTEDATIVKYQEIVKLEKEKEIMISELLNDKEMSVAEKVQTNCAIRRKEIEIREKRYAYTHLDKSEIRYKAPVKRTDKTSNIENSEYSVETRDSTDNYNNQVINLVNPISDSRVPMRKLYFLNQQDYSIKQIEFPYSPLEQKSDISKSRVSDKYSMTIIVPFRAQTKSDPRNKHLKDFKDSMTEFLQKVHNRFVLENIDADIKVVIVEQSKDNNKFNRGALLNAGYLMYPDSTVYIFHDVDLIPKENMVEEYATVYDANAIVHFAGGWKRYNKDQKYIGGVTLIGNNLFKEINGFPNDYQGWGGEDDEIMRRLETLEIRGKLERKDIDGYTDLEDLTLKRKLEELNKNKKEALNVEKYELVDQHKSTWRNNGISLGKKLLYNEVTKTEIVDNKYFSMFQIKVKIELANILKNKFKNSNLPVSSYTNKGKCEKEILPYITNEKDFTLILNDLDLETYYNKNAGGDAGNLPNVFSKKKKQMGRTERLIGGDDSDPLLSSSYCSEVDKVGTLKEEEEGIRLVREYLASVPDGSLNCFDVTKDNTSTEKTGKPAWFGHEDILCIMYQLNITSAHSEKSVFYSIRADAKEDVSTPVVFDFVGNGEYGNHFLVLYKESEFENNDIMKIIKDQSHTVGSCGSYHPNKVQKGYSVYFPRCNGDCGPDSVRVALLLYCIWKNREGIDETSSTKEPIVSTQKDLSSKSISITNRTSKEDSQNPPSSISVGKQSVKSHSPSASRRKQIDTDTGEGENNDVEVIQSSSDQQNENSGTPGDEPSDEPEDDTQRYNKEDILRTFKYMFNKIRLGVFIVIAGDKLQYFIPFQNIYYENDWNEDNFMYNKGGTITSNVEEYKTHYGINDMSDFKNWSANDCVLGTWDGKSKKRKKDLNEDESSSFEIGDQGWNEMRELITKTCASGGVRNSVLFFNRRDFPVVTSDWQEPYKNIYGSKDLDSYYKNKPFVPIIGYCKEKGYSDILVPTYADWRLVNPGRFYPSSCSGESEVKYTTEWDKKKDEVIFRGSATGCGIDADTNQRIAVAELAKDYEILNAKLTGKNNRDKIYKREGDKVYIGRYNGKIKDINANRDRVDPKVQSEYKYILHIDGHVAAYRLGRELAYKSCILKMRGKKDYEVWFSNRLVPYSRDNGKNVIANIFNVELEELMDQINDIMNMGRVPEEIATNSKKLYDEIFNKPYMMNYMKNKLNMISTHF